MQAGVKRITLVKLPLLRDIPELKELSELVVRECPRLRHVAGACLFDSTAHTPGYAFFRLVPHACSSWPTHEFDCTWAKLLIAVYSSTLSNIPH
jgi:hypothetical protein